MGFLDEGKFDFEPKLPPDADLTPASDLEPGQHDKYDLPHKQWRLMEIRGTGNIGDHKKTVINIRAKSTSEDYPNAIEVAYWFTPAWIDNRKHPQRREASQLMNFMIELGLLSADDLPSDDPTGAEICAILARAAGGVTPMAEFKATLRWRNEAYTDKTGERREKETVSLVNFGKVELEEAPF